MQTTTATRPIGANDRDQPARAAEPADWTTAQLRVTEASWISGAASGGEYQRVSRPRQQITHEEVGR
jgi:hypothetical protein